MIPIYAWPHTYGELGLGIKYCLRLPFFLMMDGSMKKEESEQLPISLFLDSLGYLRKTLSLYH
jgi:hypothetical protein